MKSLVKNFLIFLIIFLIISGVFSLLNSENKKTDELTLNELIKKIQEEKVEKIIVEEEKLNITLTDQSKKFTFKKIKQNLFWAFAYNTIAIPIAIAGFLHPVIAEIAMALYSITVVGNANLLRRKKI